MANSSPSVANGPSLQMLCFIYICWYSTGKLQLSITSVAQFTRSVSPVAVQQLAMCPSMPFTLLIPFSSSRSTSSHLISSRLISSHLISSHLIPLHLRISIATRIRIRINVIVIQKAYIALRDGWRVGIVQPKCVTASAVTTSAVEH